VWEVETGRRAFTVPGGHGPRWPDWSSDGQFLAVVGYEERGKVVVVGRSGDVVAELDLSGVEVSSAAFTADGERLAIVHAAESAICGYDCSREFDDPDVARAVDIWAWRAGEIERTIDTNAVAVVPSPTSDLIAVQAHWRSSIQDVEIWDALSGRLVSTLTGNTAEVRDIAFDASGSRIATATADGTIRLWDPRSGERQLVLRGHPGLIGGVSFSPDGSQLGSYGVEGVVRIWALDLDDLVEIAQDRLTRPFTEEECRQYLHADRCPDPR
jgi:WD40 repeat protein